MERLWLVMTETWGHKWASAMGEEPNATWKAKLRPLTQEQWLAGIERLKASLEPWPPSAPDFYRWCTGGLSRDEAKQQALVEWDERIRKEHSSYNPWGSPMTYQQLERQRTDFLARRTAELEIGSETNNGIGFDPLRVCVDEEYR